MFPTDINMVPALKKCQSVYTDFFNARVFLNICMTSSVSFLFCFVEERCNSQVGLMAGVKPGRENVFPSKSTEKLSAHLSRLVTRVYHRINKYFNI